jgi:hypothetical protein
MIKCLPTFMTDLIWQKQGHILDGVAELLQFDAKISAAIADQVSAVESFAALIVQQYWHQCY